MKVAASAILMLLALSATAQDDADKPPKLFERDSVLEVTLTAPWRKLERNKSDSDQRYPATLTYTTLAGERRTMEIEVSTRGLTRRDKVCEFPPLKLWFDKDANKGTAFRGQKSLKMVTYCKRAGRYEQFYVKEYIAYRIYNQITDYSFRVRPLQVAYQEAGSSRSPVVRFGFLIEDIDDVADRLDLEELDIKEVEPEELDARETANFAVFQYLIGNLDWAATGGPSGEFCCHNGKLIGTGEEERPVYVIPYDFDSSGLVSADYAAAPRRLGVKRITDRLYRGFCAHNDQLPAVLETFRDRREDILGLVRDADTLNNRERSETLRFLESFYYTLDSPAAVQEKLIGKCRR